MTRAGLRAGFGRISGSRRWAALAGVGLLIAYAAARAASSSQVTITEAGMADIEVGGSGARELSGLTWAGPVAGKPDTHRYLAVSDKAAAVYTLEIRLKPENGAVASCSIVSTTRLSAGSDLEGIASSRSGDTVFVCDESGAVIRQHSLSDGDDRKAGDVLKEAPLPAPFTQCRSNLGLESLARESDGEGLWTANEEALTVDGDAASADSGSVVRIVKLGADLKPTGQWAYRTDPVTANPPKNSRRERSGVVDIASLPDGTLLVLERMLDVERFIFADIPHFRSRVYRLDLSDATDVSRLSEGLQGRDYRPASKRLLWEGKFSIEKPCSFEGMALGPALADGSLSLLLISDDESGSLLGRLQALRLQLKKSITETPR